MTGSRVIPSTEMAINAQVIEFTSQVNGRSYRLLISAPARAVPPQGHPVIYLIDGNLHFGIAVDTARIQARWPDVRDPVIVGIGYQTDSVTAALAVRNIDLTTPTTADYLQSGWVANMKSRPEEYGQLDAYLRMLDDEVKPRVADAVHIDASDQVLMGHSLGGLTTLHALFRRTSSFQQFVAISPSIWWNGGDVLAYERAFTERARTGELNARVLLSVGGEESSYRTLPDKGAPMDEATLREMTDACRMVPNVVELGARLSGLAPGLLVKTVVHEGDDHNMVPASAIARGIQFTMRRP